MVSPSFSRVVKLLPRTRGAGEAGAYGVSFLGVGETMGSDVGGELDCGVGAALGVGVKVAVGEGEGVLIS